MSKVAELAYDIEQMYIEGYSPRTIAALLECPIEIVYSWMETEGVGEGEELSPYETVNS